MKYGFLAAWVNEFRNFTAVLDKLVLYPNMMYLALVKHAPLVIVLSPQDSFIYLAASDILPEGGRDIWQQLRGARISCIDIKEDDRIITISLNQKDIYGESRYTSIVCEMMPPKPNLILVKSDGLVLDALHKYSLADNPMRMILVNQPYYPPKTGFKPEADPVATIPPDFQVATFNEYFQQKHLQNLIPQDHQDSTEAKLRLLSKEMKRLSKKLLAQESDLKNAMLIDQYQAYAEGIKPNMHQIKAGQTELVTTNYLDPSLAQISIPLFPDKNPQQNLQYYIKKYQKAKNGKSIIEINLKRTRDEILALNNLILRIQSGEDIDVENKDKVSSITHKVNQADRILQFRIDSSWHIYIGRKAKENDFISTKLGKAQDWWFHSRIYRGAHVLLRNYRKVEPPAELIRACCSLAAWYSQAKFSVNVPVDYTQIRYLRKPKGSAAGFITYTNFKTIFANPKDLRTIREELTNDQDSRNNQ
jgi:predicted ribosome quality control (RQC) complex YloA/Tae2 family protein